MTFANSITEDEVREGLAVRDVRPALTPTQVISACGVFLVIQKLARLACGRWEIHFEPWEPPTSKEATCSFSLDRSKSEFSSTARTA